MRIDILTLFPEMFEGVLHGSILGRAAEKGILDFRLYNIRDYSDSKHKNTDDYPFGGGAGMVMMAQPIYSCLEDADPEHEALRICMSPRGKTLSTGMARTLASENAYPAAVRTLRGHRRARYARDGQGNIGG